MEVTIRFDLSTNEAIAELERIMRALNAVTATEGTDNKPLSVAIPEGVVKEFLEESEAAFDDMPEAAPKRTRKKREKSVSEVAKESEAPASDLDDEFATPEKGEDFEAGGDDEADEFFSEPKPKKVKEAITIDVIRNTINEKVKEEKTAGIRKLFTSYGAKLVTDIPHGKYVEFHEKLEAL